MPNIFISYRRQDSTTESMYLYNELAAAFGRDHVFIDVERLPLGEHFPSYLDDLARWADVFLVVIGANWQGGIDDAGNKRIFSGMDYVRREVEHALFRFNSGRAAIIPIVLDGVRLDTLNVPDSLNQIKNFNGINANLNTLANKLNRLITDIETIPGSKALKPTASKRIYKQESPFSVKYFYEGPIETLQLSDKGVALIRQNKSTWDIAVYNPDEPIKNRDFGDLKTHILNGATLSEAVAAAMEWFNIMPNQCMVASSKTGNNGFLSIFKKSGVETDDWQPYYRNTKFGNFDKLVKSFYGFNHNHMGNTEIIPGMGQPIIPQLAIWGIPANLQRNFGSYVCSLTTSLGARDQSGALMYFPTVSDTTLQYIDVFQYPFFKSTIYCAHVGVDNNGYHLVYV